MSMPLAAPDREARAADVGTWLFIASLVMFFASLVSGYVLLRAGSDAWRTPWIGVSAGVLPDPWFRLVWLAVAALTAYVALVSGDDRPRRHGPFARYPLHIAGLAGLAFFVRTTTVARTLAQMGHGPATDVAAASWFALNGVLAALALGGGLVTLWIAATTPAGPARRRRTLGLARYWALVASCFLTVVIGMYLL